MLFPKIGHFNFAQIGLYYFAPTVRHLHLTLGITQGYTVSMKTAISLPDPLFQKAEKLARRLGLNRSQLYVRALESFIARYDTKAIAAKLDEIYTEEGSSIDGQLMEMQIYSIRDESW
jgi:predicted transcriptional regulator